MSCGVGDRCGSDPILLWLWNRPAAAAPIQPLAWEPPYAARAALNRRKKERKREREREREGGREGGREEGKKEEEGRKGKEERKKEILIYFLEGIMWNWN